jgi:hypothetical protein
MFYMSCLFDLNFTVYAHLLSELHEIIDYLLSQGANYSSKYVECFTWRLSWPELL